MPEGLSLEGAVKIGEEVSKRYAVRSVQFYVIRIIRPKYKLADRRIVTAPIPVMAQRIRTAMLRKVCWLILLRPNIMTIRPCTGSWKSLNARVCACPPPQYCFKKVNTTFNSKHKNQYTFLSRGCMLMSGITQMIRKYIGFDV